MPVWWAEGTVKNRVPQDLMCELHPLPKSSRPLLSLSVSALAPRQVRGGAASCPNYNSSLINIISL